MSQSSGDGTKPRGYRGALESYLRAIRRYKLLTQSGEFRVATDSHRGDDEAVKQLVEANLRLVVKIAKEYRSTHVTFEELIAEGNLGLLEAARRFDPARGVRFVSYAAWWIRKYMLQAVDRQAHQMSSPRPETGSDPAISADGRPRRQRRLRVLSFDDFMQNSGDRNVLEKFVGEDAADPEEKILEHQLAQALTAILPRMPDLERTILAAHYGLGGEEPRTLQQIGQTLGLTRERVRQIELRALDRARRLLQKGRND